MQASEQRKTILILGAGADMAQPLIRLLFKQWQPSRFILLARNTGALQSLVTEGQLEGHVIEMVAYDLEAPTPVHFSSVQVCLTYAGWLPPDNTEPDKAMFLNYTGIKSFIDQLIADNAFTLEHILITGSIAGVRVRPANRAYGQAKAALHRYAAQLRGKWKGKIAVTLVVPGYVQTRMLTGMKTPAMLTLSTQKLAEKYTGWLESKPAVVYSQPVWKGIAILLQMLPGFLIQRMKK